MLYTHMPDSISITGRKKSSHSTHSIGPRPVSRLMLYCWNLPLKFTHPSQADVTAKSIWPFMVCNYPIAPMPLPSEIHEGLLLVLLCSLPLSFLQLLQCLHCSVQSMFVIPSKLRVCAFERWISGSLWLLDTISMSLLRLVVLRRVLGFRHLDCDVFSLCG